jgi:hypothetical protein
MSRRTRKAFIMAIERPALDQELPTASERRHCGMPTEAGCPNVSPGAKKISKGETRAQLLLDDFELVLLSLFHRSVATCARASFRRL